MASMKRGAVVASTLMLIAVIASACNQPYSTAPAFTNTPINPTSLFASPETPGITMSDIANFGTQTAIAQTGTPLVVATQTPGPGIATQDLSATATPQVSINTATQAVVGATQAVIGTPPTSLPVGTRPPTYTLHRGEFPYCIARRFDVDPSQLLSLNGLANGDIYYPNLTLKIPQSGSFPGTRARETHPSTYTVTSGETLYSIACRYGDVDPGALATANGLSSPDASLTAGMQLKFP